LVTRLPAIVELVTVPLSSNLMPSASPARFPLTVLSMRSRWESGTL
jgi:hypothetical protein